MSTHQHILNTGPGLFFSGLDIIFPENILKRKKTELFSANIHKSRLNGWLDPIDDTDINISLDLLVRGMLYNQLLDFSIIKQDRPAFFRLIRVDQHYFF